MAWSQHNRNDSEYLHPFGRKQQAVFCQCHHRNPTRNVKISEQKNCSEIKKMCLRLYNDTSYEIELGDAGGAVCTPFAHPLHTFSGPPSPTGQYSFSPSSLELWINSCKIRCNMVKYCCEIVKYTGGKRTTNNRTHCVWWICSYGTTPRCFGARIEFAKVIEPPVYGG